MAGEGTLASATWPVRKLTETAVDTLLDHVEGSHHYEPSAHAPVTAVLPSEPLPGPSARLRALPAAQETTAALPAVQQLLAEP